MKILYVGDLTPGWTSIMRKRTLEDLGHQVTTVNVRPVGVDRREAMLFYRAVRKLHGPFDFAGANLAIIRQMQDRAFDLYLAGQGDDDFRGHPAEGKGAAAELPNYRIFAGRHVFASQSVAAVFE